MAGEHHWCIADNCKHGTLNGSLSLGSFLLAEYNRGYRQGKDDTKIDDELKDRIVEAVIGVYRCANDDTVCQMSGLEHLMDLARAWGDRAI